MSSFAADVQAYLRAVIDHGRERVVVPPFTAYIDHTVELRFYSYAIPDVGAELHSPAQRRAALATLIEEFRARHRRPRIEAISDVAPWIREDATAVGFELELETPLMACTRETLRRPPPPAGMELVIVERDSPAAQVRALLEVQAGSFAEAEPVTEERVERWRERGSDRASVLATIGGAPAAGGSFLPPVRGLTELVGIGTLPGFRGRGLAGAVTAALAATAFERGAHTATLTPGDAGAQRVYARAGFAAAATMLALATPG